MTLRAIVVGAGVVLACAIVSGSGTSRDGGGKHRCVTISIASLARHLRARSARECFPSLVESYWSCATRLRSRTESFRQASVQYRYRASHHRQRGNLPAHRRHERERSCGYNGAERRRREVDLRVRAVRRRTPRVVCGVYVPPAPGRLGAANSGPSMFGTPTPLRLYAASTPWAKRLAAPRSPALRMIEASRF